MRKQRRGDSSIFIIHIQLGAKPWKWISVVVAIALFPNAECLLLTVLLILLNHHLDQIYYSWQTIRSEEIWLQWPNWRNLIIFVIEVIGKPILQLIVHNKYDKYVYSLFYENKLAIWSNSTREEGSLCHWPEWITAVKAAFVSEHLKLWRSMPAILPETKLTAKDMNASVFQNGISPIRCVSYISFNSLFTAQSCHGLPASMSTAWHNMQCMHTRRQMKNIVE